MLTKIAMRAALLLRDRNFILVLSVVFGLAIGERIAGWTQPAVLPLLALVMALSTASITSKELASLKTMPGRVVIAILLNYLVMGGIIILMGWWLIDDNELWAGLVVIAAMPPAVASVPWSSMFGGDTLLSLISLVGAYLLALVLTPVIIILILGIDVFSPVELLILLGELVLAPLIVSRVLLYTGISRRIEKWRGTIVNWCFFIVLFTIIGLNRQAFFGDFDVLLKLVAIGFVFSFVLSYAIELVGKAFHARQATIISMIFIGTMKNVGLASGILLALFSERATIPSSVFTVLGLARTIWLGFHFRSRNTS